LQTVQDQTAVRALFGLWEYRNVLRHRAGLQDATPEIEEEFGDLVERLGGRRPARRILRTTGARRSANPAKVKSLAAEFLAVSTKDFRRAPKLIAGFWLWEVKDMDEAVAWVKRCPNPMPRLSEIEIRPRYEMADLSR